MSSSHKVFKIFLPIIILAVAGAGVFAMIKFRAAPEKKEKPDTGALVEIMAVNPESHQVKVYGTGTVNPRREISITPQVDGRIIAVAPNFVAGGFFQEGELLFAIEPVDYELAVERARAAVAKAELELATMESRAKIAQFEWQKLSKDGTTQPNPLVLYEPQLKDAQANLASARANLRQAELDLARTKITAPFNCRVRSEQIDVGQYVKSGTNVAVVAGTDTAEIVVPMPLTDIRWLDIPLEEEDSAGSKAAVQLEIAGRLYQWSGRVIRSLGEVDPQGRMVRVVVSVDDPYNRCDGGKRTKPDLVAGMFVDVVLYGERLTDIFAIPRSAVRENSTIWLMNGDRKLLIQKVEIVRQEKENVLISKGLAAGDRVVLTNLVGAANGMLLRLEEARTQQ